MSFDKLEGDVREIAGLAITAAASLARASGSDEPLREIVRALEAVLMRQREQAMTGAAMCRLIIDQEEARYN